MDIGKALTFITDDPRWKEKLAIGTGVVLVSTILSFILIGVVGYLIVMGYMVRLLQNVRDNHTHPLPEWDQWGDDLVRGAKLFVVLLVWSLPIVVFAIPSAIGGALADSRADATVLMGNIILICSSCLMIIYGFLLAVIMPGATIAFSSNERISSGLQVREIWEWTQDNLGQVVIVAIVYLAASIGISLVASIVGVLLCVIGLIVTIPLATLVTYIFQHHLYGQLARLYPMTPIGPSGPDVPPAPPVEPTTYPAPESEVVSTPPAAPVDDTPPVTGIDTTTEEETIPEDISTDYPGASPEDRPDDDSETGRPSSTI